MDVTMIRVVEDYIFKMKGKRVKISPPKNIRERNLLIKAFTIAHDK